MLGRGLRQDPMPEIENEGSAPERDADRRNRPFKSFTTDHQRHRIEVALYSDVPLQPSPKMQWCGGIEPDSIDACFSRVALVQQSGPSGKTDDRHRRKPGLKRLDNPLSRFDDETRKFRLRQHPSPAVEELNYLGPGLDLSHEIN